MKRRDFVAAAGLAPAASLSAWGGERKPQYFELRHYKVATRSGAHRNRVADFLGQAAIPAWNRHGIEHVGAFNVVYGPNAPSIYVLLPHPTLESVATLRDRLAQDEQYQRDGEAFLAASLDNPAFARVESSLMKAFSGMPAVAVPERAANNDPRIFELRIYESHSDHAAMRKIEMFNKGEIDIFHDTGLTPVFFGESIVGPLLPNLTYLLIFDDFEDREASWAAFRDHPDWKTMSSDPYYADTVSNITSIILRPLPFSQL